jgi:hypothetical protein
VGRDPTTLVSTIRYSTTAPRFPCEFAYQIENISIDYLQLATPNWAGVLLMIAVFWEVLSANGFFFW